jgi:hypothetical protein
VPSILSNYINLIKSVSFRLIGLSLRSRHTLQKPFENTVKDSPRLSKIHPDASPAGRFSTFILWLH